LEDLPTDIRSGLPALYPAPGKALALLGCQFYFRRRQAELLLLPAAPLYLLHVRFKISERRDKLIGRGGVLPALAFLSFCEHFVLGGKLTPGMDERPAIRFGFPPMDRRDEYEDLTKSPREGLFLNYQSKH
jgi:hypothetical protein